MVTSQVNLSQKCAVSLPKCRLIKVKSMNLTGNERAHSSHQRQGNRTTHSIDFPDDQCLTSSWLPYWPARMALARQTVARQEMKTFPRSCQKSPFSSDIWEWMLGQITTPSPMTVTPSNPLCPLSNKNNSSSILHTRFAGLKVHLCKADWMRQKTPCKKYSDRQSQTKIRTRCKSTRTGTAQIIS